MNEKRKTIPHIAVLCDPASFHTQKWSQALQRNGAKVTVFSFSDEKIEGINCVKVAPNYTLKGKLTYLSFMYSGQALRQALEAHQVDVLNPINVTPYGVWAARSGFRPLATVSMGADILEYPPKPGDSPYATWTNRERPGMLGRLTNRLKYHFYRFHVKKALDVSAFITGDNLELVNSVINWFDIPSPKVHLNRWGVEEKLFHPQEERLATLRQKYGIKKGQTVVLSPRGMKPIYQGELILNAFEKLVQQLPEVKFIMFSAGYEVSKAVKEKAIMLGEQHPNFYYEFGLIPREEVIELWSLVDVFISAPLYDGYSNAVAEGRYGGAIPIVNAIPGNREILEHDKTALFVDPFTSEYLVETIRDLIPQVSTVKKRFHEVSLPWILEHSELNGNIRKFIELCDKMSNPTN
jgi:glycosyltransferase involved in cell wall biosynthesis